MTPPRRRFLHLAAGAAALPALPRIARAQAYPRRPVQFRRESAEAIVRLPGLLCRRRPDRPGSAP